MKIKSFRASLAIVGLFAAAAIPLAASGGFTLSAPVVITPTVFYGGFGYVHNSANNVEHIGCLDFGSSAMCVARDASYTVATCGTSNPQHLATIRALNDGAMAYFYYDATGACTNVIGYNSSQFPNK